ncbi:hypothetical protein JG687_00013262 [Phytophthora cactorum]|uniref:Uncharacterized protein n=1 Tax=Phytophthora cactorum TaxID=29920 RepID=A0A8T1U2C0_9STRA|nr:hypothetical protein JG687_00013262 [Phytophthora cactorum]
MKISFPVDMKSDSALPLTWNSSDCLHKQNLQGKRGQLLPHYRRRMRALLYATYYQS